MFRKNLFITRGVDESIPKQVISTLWGLIHQHEGKRKLDYLQVFTLKTVQFKGVKTLLVEWTQEKPEFSLNVYFPCTSFELDTKVWVICSGEGTDDEYSTMLLPEEY